MKTTIALPWMMILGVMTIGVIVSGPVLAADEPEVNCKDNMESQTQQVMNICAGRAAKEADRELNRVYRLVRASYKQIPAQEKRLVTAQLAWIKFRDAECNASAGRFDGGSIAPLMYASCVEHLTKQRSQDLEKYLEK